MENTITIREAGPADAEFVADMARRTFIDSFAHHNTAENMRIFLEEQNPKERQMAEVGAAGRHFLLAYIDDEPAGYVSLRIAEPPKELQGEKAIEIVQLYAEKKLIGKGIGPALMQAALDLAQTKGFDWVWLGVWEHNHRAQAFYRKYGFQRFGEHIFFVGLDAQTDHWMRKRLSE
jgi:ribosomal protein S18 acetylase RimI-like enzyme